MHLLKLKCTFCGKEFFREIGRQNEAKKFGWNQYCSLVCQYKTRVTQVRMKCGNPHCGKIVARLKSQFEKSKSGRIFCSASCTAVFNNASKIKIKHCKICGTQFYGGLQYCSKRCACKAISIQRKVIKVSKKQVLSEVRSFYQEHGRIPVKREYRHYDVARDRFGNWNNAIAAAGFEPNPVLFAKKYIARDGHKCDSFSEKIIDDWLYKNHIKHRRNVSYPENSSLKVDFVTDDLWIEFFGLALAGDLEEYNRSMKKKFSLAKKHGLPLLALYPRDLFPMNHLAEIIRR